MTGQLDLFSKPRESGLPPHLAHLRPPMPFIEALRLFNEDFRRRHPECYRENAKPPGMEGEARTSAEASPPPEADG